MDALKNFTTDGTMLGRGGKGTVFVNATGTDLFLRATEDTTPTPWPSRTVAASPELFRGLLRAIEVTALKMLDTRDYRIVIDPDRWSDAVGLPFAIDYVRTLGPDVAEDLLNSQLELVETFPRDRIVCGPGHFEGWLEAFEDTVEDGALDHG